VFDSVSLHPSSQSSQPGLRNIYFPSPSLHAAEAFQPLGRHTSLFLIYTGTTFYRDISKARSYSYAIIHSSLEFPLRIDTEVAQLIPFRTITMQPRQAAFRLLRRIALQDFKPSAITTLPVRRKPSSSRNVHIRNTPCLRTSDSSSKSSPLARFKIPRSTPSTPPAEKPTYELTFTCKPCSTRSTHRVSKQGYHHGSVLICCPGCKNRHVISDHLGVSYCHHFRAGS